VEIGDGLYIDGGGFSPTNADVLCGLGLDLVIVVAPMSAVPRAARERRDAALRHACRAMLLAEAAALGREGTQVAVVEPDAGDLRVMGRLIGIDVLDEARCDAVVHRVRASTLRRARRGAFAGLERLSPPLARAA
jgi:NTE family protein